MRNTERKRLLHGGLCQALYFNIICGMPSHPCVPEGSHKGGLGKLALGVGSEQQHLDCSSAVLDSALSCLVQLRFKSLLIPLEYWFPYCSLGILVSILSSESGGELPRNPMSILAIHRPGRSNNQTELQLPSGPPWGCPQV